MNNISNVVNRNDFALVTPFGILHKDIYYTCSRAIREQWFEIAYKDGEWNIQIICTPSDLNIIYIMTEFEEFEECSVVVRESFQGFNLENYLERVQLMKLARDLLKK